MTTVSNLVHSSKQLQTFRSWLLAEAG